MADCDYENPEDGWWPVIASSVAGFVICLPLIIAAVLHLLGII